MPKKSLLALWSGPFFPLGQGRPAGGGGGVRAMGGHGHKHVAGDSAGGSNAGSQLSQDQARDAKREAD